MAFCEDPFKALENPSSQGKAVSGGFLRLGTIEQPEQLS